MRKGDGLYLRGRTWILDCRIDGTRHVVKLGKQEYQPKRRR
jgi:hypothetical protein